MIHCVIMRVRNKGETMREVISAGQKMRQLERDVSKEKEKQDLVKLINAGEKLRKL